MSDYIDWEIEPDNRSGARRYDGVYAGGRLVHVGERRVDCAGCAAAGCERPDADPAARCGGGAWRAGRLGRGNADCDGGIGLTM